MIFICDFSHKVIRQKPEMMEPTEEGMKKYYNTAMNDYNMYLGSLLTYPCLNILESEAGKEVQESDFEVEEQFWTGQYWVPTYLLVNCKVKPGTKTRQVAIILRPAVNEQEREEVLCVFCGEVCNPAPTERGWSRINRLTGLHFDCAEKVASQGRTLSPTPIAKEDAGYWKEAFEKATSFINESGNDPNFTEWLNSKSKQTP